MDEFDRKFWGVFSIVWAVFTVSVIIGGAIELWSSF